MIKTTELASVNKVVYSLKKTKHSRCPSVCQMFNPRARTNSISSSVWKQKMHSPSILMKRSCPFLIEFDRGSSYLPSIVEAISYHL